MRRIGVEVLTVVALLSAFALGGSTSAQEATPSASAEHPLVGSWMLDTDVEDSANNPSLDIFSSDGTYLEVDAEGGVAVGVWEPTGANTANVTFWFIDPEGTGIVRASVEVAPDGQSFTAPYTIEFVGPDGTSTGEIGPGMAAGTKLAIEPQGTPVGTFEEIFGTPAGTPAG